MSVRLLGLLVVLASWGGASCRFDEGGLSGSAAGDAASGDGRSVDAPIDPSADAAWPDAALPCVDQDDDSFLAQGLPDADCSEPIDCDDLDPDAYPGQADSFTEPRISGGFDYNCDGVESPALDTSAGSDCYWDWFTCRGTGWYDGVPGCGEQGIWHECSANGVRCEENGSSLIRMACR